MPDQDDSSTQAERLGEIAGRSAPSYRSADEAARLGDVAGKYAARYSPQRKQKAQSEPFGLAPGVGGDNDEYARRYNTD